jgi:transglutaminase-like putative cysteine protease
LSRGSGTYTVGVYENLYDEKYTPLLSQDVAVELDDELEPFLYPNQLVDFAVGDRTVQLSQELAANATSDVEAVDQIYLHVVQNISYDYDKAESVAPGYLPSNDETLASGKGICFDFASLAASLMRAQRLPTRLEVGYCGQAYHAWIEVYTAEKGWIRKKIEFTGGSWVLMDPTLDSASKGTGDIEQVIGDGESYQPMFQY